MPKIGDIMEFELTTEQKVIALNNVKAQVINEMYSMILFLGLDPDTFDPLTWERAENGTGNEARLVALISAISLIDTKLAALA
jgi:hypothetical protein